MFQEPPQKFVAYRSQSDEFEIRFFGGPLDGTAIVTDIFPDTETFVHRIRNRNYVYRYIRASRLVFHARIEGFELPAR